MSSNKDTELEYKGEIYGRIWEAMTWNKEARAYQHLTNQLFMAAKEDIIAEKRANGGHYQKKTKLVYNKTNGNYESHLIDPQGRGDTPALDKVIADLVKDEKNENKRKAIKGFLELNLSPSYAVLRDTLDDVRVLGVGNNTIESIGKACKIALKTMITGVLSVYNALSAASIPLMVANPASIPVIAGINAVGTAATMAAQPFATGASQLLTNVRAGMKDTVKKTPFANRIIKERANSTKQSREH